MSHRFDEEIKNEMKLQLWRNATLELTIGDWKLLVDPMLGEKGSFGPFPWTDDKRDNPLVDLPFTKEELKRKLNQINAIFVSHLHPDHFDQAAIDLIDKNKTIICPYTLTKTIKSYGFRSVIEIRDGLNLNGINLQLTMGRHGEGEIGKLMGPVYGLVISQGSNSIYIAGDTIWCPEVGSIVEFYKPKHMIVAGGAATFQMGKPVTMNAQDIKELADFTSGSLIWLTHLEAISPCQEGRDFLVEFIKQNNLSGRVFVPKDGEEFELKF